MQNKWICHNMEHLCLSQLEPARILQAYRFFYKLPLRSSPSRLGRSLQQLQLLSLLFKKMLLWLFWLHGLCASLLHVITRVKITMPNMQLYLNWWHVRMEKWPITYCFLPAKDRMYNVCPWSHVSSSFGLHTTESMFTDLAHQVDLPVSEIIVPHKIQWTPFTHYHTPSLLMTIILVNC